MTFAQAKETLRRLKRVPFNKMDNKERVALNRASMVIMKEVGGKGLVQFIKSEGEV